MQPFNPLSARIFTDLVIRGLSITQESMGREAPRYPPRTRTIKGLYFHDKMTRPWQLRG